MYVTDAKQQQKSQYYHAKLNNISYDRTVQNKYYTVLQTIKEREHGKKFNSSLY